MTDAEILTLVSQMRAAQKRYFKYRTGTTLNESKELERQVDKALAARLSLQGTLI